MNLQVISIFMYTLESLEIHKRVFWRRIVPIKKKVHIGYLKEVSQKILSSIVINPKPHLDNFITECINVGISNVVKGRHRVLDEESETKRDKTLSVKHMPMKNLHEIDIQIQNVEEVVSRIQKVCSKLGRAYWLQIFKEFFKSFDMRQLLSRCKDFAKCQSS